MTAQPGGRLCDECGECGEVIARLRPSGRGGRGRQFTPFAPNVSAFYMIYLSYEYHTTTSVLRVPLRDPLAFISLKVDYTAAERHDSALVKSWRYPESIL